MTKTLNAPFIEPLTPNSIRSYLRYMQDDELKSFFYCDVSDNELFFHMLNYDDVHELMDDLGEYPLTNREKLFILYNYRNHYQTSERYNTNEWHRTLLDEDLDDAIQRVQEEMQGLFIWERYYVDQNGAMWQMQFNDRLTENIRGWIFKLMVHFKDLERRVPITIDFATMDYDQWDGWLSTVPLRDTIIVAETLRQSNISLNDYFASMP